MQAIRSGIRKLQFSASPLGIFINPFFLARRALRQELDRLAPHASGRLLDVGCGNSPYRSLFAHCEYVGLDLDTPASRQRAIADLFYDGTDFPLPPECFDTLLCNQVLEHVFRADQFVSEMARVLKPGGHLILTVPFVWDEHEQPHDFARYSSFGLRDLLTRNGFTIEQHRKTLPNAAILFQLANAYIYKLARPRSPLALGIWTLVLMCPISLLGWISSGISPRNEDLFLDQVVLATKRL